MFIFDKSKTISENGFRQLDQFFPNLNTALIITHRITRIIILLSITNY